MSKLAALVILGLALVAACAPPLADRTAGAGQSSSTPGAPKRLVVAIQSDPPVLVGRLTDHLEPGLDSVESFYNPGLGGTNRAGALVPVMAAQVPTVANGLWTVQADGKMSTVWKLRVGSKWHDGTPLTAQDYVFTYQVDGDKDVPFAVPSAALRQVERMEATDDLTFTVFWKGPFIDADTAFMGRALPRHLLEKTYREDKASLGQLAYWAQPPIGVGPYRVQEWARGSHIRLEANDQYTHGRPKIDVIEARLIPDQNTLLANILAGGIDFTLGKSITLEQAIELRERWNGRIETMPQSSLQAFPQLLNPTPAAINDARFRRALTHAIDRQELADSLLGPGFTSVVHSYLSPTEPPEFQSQANRVVKYEYDPRKAVEILQGMGFARGPDGLFRDERGQPFSVEVRTITTDINTKAILAMGDFWQRSGIAAEPYVIPRQLAQDQEYRATYPGYEVVRNSADRPGLARLPISQTPLPENGFRGNNRSRYVNQEFDGMLTRYYQTIPIDQRAQLFGDHIHDMTEKALVLGLFYDVEPTAIGPRLKNAGVGDHRETWSVVDWDLAA